MRTTRRQIPVVLAATSFLVLGLAAPAQAAPGFDPDDPGARYGGSDRYDTAALVAIGTWDAADTVIVANGEKGGTDTISASFLVGVLAAPVVLTARDGVLPSPAAAVIRELDPERVIVVGDEASVSAATARALGYERELVRLGGADRFATNALVLAAGMAALPQGQTVSDVVVARGDVGGIETAAGIAEFALTTGAGFTTTGVGLANGYRIDALAAGPAAGRRGYPLLLTEDPGSLGSGTRSYLSAHASTLSESMVFGSEEAVSPGATLDARSLGGGSAS